MPNHYYIQDIYRTYSILFRIYKKFSRDSFLKAKDGTNHLIFEARVTTKDTSIIIRAKVKDNNIPDNFPRSFSSAFKNNFWIFRNDNYVGMYDLLYAQRDHRHRGYRSALKNRSSFALCVNILNTIGYWYLVVLSLFYCSSCVFIALCFMFLLCSLHVLLCRSLCFYVRLCAS